MGRTVVRLYVICDIIFERGSGVRGCQCRV